LLTKVKSLLLHYATGAAVKIEEKLLVKIIVRLILETQKRKWKSWGGYSTSSSPQILT
jgi:hypothetical protein